MRTWRWGTGTISRRRRRTRRRCWRRWTGTGLQRAVVHYVYAQTKSAVEGNALLFEAIAGQEARLIPQCVVSPTDASLAQLRDFHGRGLLRSVRLHDLSKQGVPFADWVHGDALAWLQEQGIALCVPLPEVDVAQLATTLQGYPELRVVLAGVHYQHVLLVRPLMRLLPQLHLELSRYETLGDVEALCARVRRRAAAVRLVVSAL